MNKREKKDNLDDNKLKITIYSESRDKTKVLEYLIILIGVMATMLTITTAFNWHDVYEQLIIIESIIITFIMCILFDQNKKINIIISILLLLIGIVNIHKIISSFVKVICNYDKYYVSDGALVVGICSMILAFFITFIVKKKPRIILVLIVTLPFLLIVTLSGKLPSNRAFAMLIVFWISVLAMNTKNKKMHTNRELIEKNNAMVGMTVIIIAFAIIIGITQVFTKDDYDISNISSIYNNIDYFIDNMSLENFKNIFTGNTVATGGVSGGELGNISKVEYDKETDLIVNLPVEGNLNRTIYLRGYIGGEYTSNAWIDIKDNDYKKLQEKLDDAKLSSKILQNINSSEIAAVNAAEYNKENFVNYKGQMSINNIGANNEYAYLPYDAIYTRDYNYLKDLKCSIEDKDEYSVQYYNYEADIDTIERIFSDKGNGYNKDTDKLEEIYRDYVYEVYTRLPSDKLQNIQKIYKGFSNNNSIGSCIDIAKDIVLDGTRYDLNPGVLPEGNDFVEYFLYENKKGYCVHFASAGAVILRAMGIPARYVEGYVINQEDFENAAMFLSDFSIEYNVSDITALNSITLEKLDSLLEEDINEDLISSSISYLYNIDGEIYQLNINPMTSFYDGEDYYKKTGDNTFIYMGVEYKIEDKEVKRIDGLDYDSIFIGDNSSIVTSTSTNVTLTDERAHAWVEVYVDGYGWYPVEFTPNSTYSDYSTDNITKLDDNNENVNSVTDKNEDYTEEPSDEEVTDKQSNTTYSSKKDNRLVRNIRIVVIVLVLIIAISIFVIIIRRFLYIHKNKVMEKNGDKNKAIIYFYDQLVKAIEFYLGENLTIDSYKKFAENIENRIEFIDRGQFNKLTDIFLKARYSNNQIDREELENFIKISSKIKQEIYHKLSRRKSFSYKYMKKCI